MPFPLTTNCTLSELAQGTRFYQAKTNNSIVLYREWIDREKNFENIYENWRFLQLKWVKLGDKLAYEYIIYRQTKANLPVNIKTFLYGFVDYKYIRIIRCSHQQIFNEKKYLWQTNEEKKICDICIEKRIHIDPHKLDSTRLNRITYLDTMKRI